MPTRKLKKSDMQSQSQPFTCGAEDTYIFPKKKQSCPSPIYPSLLIIKQGLIDILAVILCGEPRVTVIVVWVQHSTTATRISAVRLEEMQIKGAR